MVELFLKHLLPSAEILVKLLSDKMPGMLKIDGAAFYQSADWRIISISISKLREEICEHSQTFVFALYRI